MRRAPVARRVTLGGTERSPTDPGEPHCSERSVAYDVTLPGKPTPLNESSARAVARAFERRYVLARLRADHENVTVDSATFREVDARRVDGGFEVAVTLAVHYSTDRLTAKGGYPTTYRLTDRRFVRDGRTLRCWG